MEVLGDAEDAAVDPDVLADDEHVGVALHLLVQRQVERLDHGQFCHRLLMRCPRIGGGSGGSPVPSFLVVAASRASSSARSAASSARQLGIGVVEHAERIGGRGRLEGRDAARDLLVDRLVEARLEEVLLLQIGDEARQRVLALPGLDLLLGPVLGGIVRGGVDAEAIRDAFDERGAAAGARALDGLAGRHLHGEHVVAVHLNAGNP